MTGVFSSVTFIRQLLPPAGELMLQQVQSSPHAAWRWHPIQYKRTYRKIVRSQCTLTYEKTFYYLKRSRSYLSKTQDTIVHRFSKNCIQFQFWSTCETEYVDGIQKPHSEIVRQTSRLSWWFNHKLIWLKHVEVKDMQVYTLYTKG